MCSKTNVYSDAVSAVRERRPLVHCITNGVTVNDCANALLCIGARPVMAEHPDEAAEITAAADALLLNLGTPTDSKMRAMRISAETAKKKGIPVVIDCVGAASSRLRYDFMRELIRMSAPAAVKGNAAEITALVTGAMSHSGVDAAGTAAVESVSDAARLRKFSEAVPYAVLETGKADLAAYAGNMIEISGGSPLMPRVTGMGCMLGCVLAAVCAVENDGLRAAVSASAIMAHCGAAVHEPRGLGTYRVGFFDALSSLGDDGIKEALKNGSVALSYNGQPWNGR